MNITYDYDHPFMAFAMQESAQLDSCDEWLAWVQRAEAAIGHDLDGDESAPARVAGKSDGYSLDGAYDAFCAGATVDAYVRATKSNPAYRGRAPRIDEKG